MSFGARIRVRGCLSAGPSHAQAVLACDAVLLRAAADAAAAGVRLTGAQASALRTAWEVLADAPVGPGSAPRLASAIAETVAAAQRDLVAAAVVATLRAENWTVTVVEGSAPDRYTGIEASSSTGHVIVAVGAAELLADHVTAHDRRSVIDLLADGLREVGWTAVIDSGISHDRCQGSLYALPGQPTRAHAVQASLRRQPRAAGRCRQEAGPAAPIRDAG